MGLTPGSQARDLFSGDRNVLIEVGAIVLERPLQTVGKRGGRTPSKGRRDLGRIGVEVADVDCLLLRWPRRASESSALRDPYHHRDQIAVLDRFEAAHVE